jgi:hypothetical protein
LNEERVKEMKKLLAIALAFALFATPQAAFAAKKTVKLSNYGSTAIESALTLPTKNTCKEIPFKYDLSGNYSWPYAFTSFSIENKAGDMLGSVIIRAGDEYDEDGNEAFVPYKGSSSIKVCREDWADLDEEGNGDEYIGAKKGTYYFGFTMTQIRPLRMNSSKTITVTFK